MLIMIVFLHRRTQVPVPPRRDSRDAGVLQKQKIQTILDLPLRTKEHRKSPPFYSFLFIQTYELRLVEDVPFHGSLESGLGCVRSEGQRGVEGIKLEEITMRA